MKTHILKHFKAITYSNNILQSRRVHKFQLTELNKRGENFIFHGDKKNNKT